MHQDRDLLMLSLTRFFSNTAHIRHVVSIIRGTSDISLRLIDWFITTYAKRTNAITCVGEAHLNVYLSYRAQLKTYSKQQFDPFRRHERIRFVYGDDESVETTVGQLNFFRWAIENKVLEYIRANKGVIEEAMAAASPSAAAVEASVAGSVAAEVRPPSSKSSASVGTGGCVHHRCKTLISFE